MKRQKTKSKRTKVIANAEGRYPNISNEEWRKFENRRDLLFSSAMLIMVCWIMLAIVLGGIFGL